MKQEKMEEDDLVTRLRTLLAAEQADDPEPRAGSAAALRAEGLRAAPVSYTHLTLPTIYSV